MLAVLTFTNDLNIPGESQNIYAAFEKVKFGYWLGLFPYVVLQMIPFLLGGQLTAVIQASGQVHPQTVTISLLNGIYTNHHSSPIGLIYYLLVLVPLLSIVLAAYFGSKIDRGVSFIKRGIAAAGCYTLLANGLAFLFRVAGKGSFTLTGVENTSQTFKLAIGNSLIYGIFAVFIISAAIYLGTTLISSLLRRTEVIPTSSSGLGM